MRILSLNSIQPLKSTGIEVLSTKFCTTDGTCSSKHCLLANLLSLCMNIVEKGGVDFAACCV